MVQRMMNRREFARRCALIAAGVVAADQLDVLEMLAPRRLFAGADFVPNGRRFSWLDPANERRLVKEQLEWTRGHGKHGGYDIIVYGNGWSPNGPVPDLNGMRAYL